MLKLMIDSDGSPQQYKFSVHEVKAANPKLKGGFTFTLKVHKGKAVNDIRTSLIAKDLLHVLQQSGKAAELTESSTYEFKFDRHFVLHVTKTDIALEVPELPDDQQSTITEQTAG